MFYSIANRKTEMPGKANALSGRNHAMPVTELHFINGRPLKAPYPQYYQQAMFGMGCFWGAERLFWEIPGVYVTAVGYAAGYTPNPTYEEVCSGRTGHNEVVLVIYNPKTVLYCDLLTVFWEGHDPTQGMRQGNDVGSQYRSGIYCVDQEQQRLAKASCLVYGKSLEAAGFGRITTEILDAPTFYFAETYHQQYLGRNPSGYCGLGGVGVSYS